jgi:hypothetical protein
MIATGSNPFQSVGQGEWVSIGDRHFAFTFVRHVWDEARNLTGQITLWGAIELDEVAGTLSSPFQFSLTDLDGNTLRTGEGTSQGTRIVVTLPMGS